MNIIDEDNIGIPEMNFFEKENIFRKEINIKEDGRYIIYYDFKNNDLEENVSDKT